MQACTKFDLICPGLFWKNVIFNISFVSRIEHCKLLIQWEKRPVQGQWAGHWAEHSRNNQKFGGGEI